MLQFELPEVEVGSDYEFLVSASVKKVRIRRLCRLGDTECCAKPSGMKLIKEQLSKGIRLRPSGPCSTCAFPSSRPKSKG